MADINSLYNSSDTLKRPSHYDNYYYPKVTPYNYQNINIDDYNNNIQIIEKELNKAIKQLNNIHWFKIINTEDYINEKDGTIESEITNNFGNLIKQYYQVGNRDLLINYSIDIEDIIYAGYTPTENSILYPQTILCWNQIYNKWYAVWYTPILEDETIISKQAAEAYIRDLFQSTDFLANDTNKIILRVSNELDFTAIDTISVGKTYETDNVKRVREEINRWCKSLSTAQKMYQDLLVIANNPTLTSNYIFVDDDISLFSKTNRRSYFTFNINQNSYVDLGIEFNEINDLQYWEPNKKYKVGDYVLLEEENNDNYLYYCVRDNEGQEFDTYGIVEEKDSQGQTVEVAVLQWKLISTDYANELEAILEADPNFDPTKFYRFVFPSLEDRRARESYPNGQLKPDGQAGTLSVLNNEKFFTIVPTYVYDQQTHKENIVYTYALDRDVNVNSSQKVIIYFLKSQMDNNIINFVLEEKFSKLKDQAFYKRTDLLKAVIRSGAQSIGNKAFGGCENLQQFLFPSSLRILGDMALAGCSSLKRASLPNAIVSLRGTFNGCTNLDSVTLSPYCVELGDSTFSNCVNLKKVYNIDNIYLLGKSVFLNCESLKSFTFSNDIEEIPDRAFKNCKNCVFTIRNKNIKKLGVSSFEGCAQLTETFNFDLLEELNEGTYKNCTSLEEVTFTFSNDNVNKIIPKNFCYGCYNIKSINLGTAKVLDDSCFQNCASLQEVTVPVTVEQLGTNIFYDCFKLKILKVPTVYPGKNEAWIENENILTSANRINWIDPTFTTVTDYNGVVIKWKRAPLT